MSKKLPYYQMYPSDFDTDENVRRLNDAEAGFFLRCLNHAWMNHGSIPAEISELASCLSRRCSYVRRVWVKVGKCFKPHPTDPTRLVNPRQWKDYCAKKSKSEVCSESGRRGAEVTNSGFDRSGDRRPDPAPRARARSGSNSDSVSQMTVQEQQTADAPDLSVRKFVDIEKTDRDLKQRWKKTGPDQITTQELSAAIMDGADLSEVYAGLLAWCDWYDAQPDGWRYCHERLIDALRAKKWDVKPPPINNGRRMSGGERAVMEIYREAVGGR